MPFASPQAAICRSSQPLSGFSARCLEDEQMLEAILRSNPRSDFMYVVDTRPKVSPFCLRNCENTSLTVRLCMFRWALFNRQSFASWMCSQQKPRKHPDCAREPRSILCKRHSVKPRLLFFFKSYFALQKVCSDDEANVFLAECNRQPGCRKRLWKWRQLLQY